MPRLREREKLTQPSIAEYFSVRKPRKTVAKNLKEKEKLSVSLKTKKVLDSGLDSKQKIRSQSSSSKLLISVLEKHASTAIVSRKENNNPNLKNVLDSSQVDTLETTLPNINKIISFNEENLEEKELSKQNDCFSVKENFDSSSKRENIPTATVSEENLKKVEIVSSSSQKGRIPKEILEKSEEKVLINVKPAKSDGPDIKNTKKCLPELNKSQAKCEKSEEPIVTNKSQSETSRIFLPLPSDYKFLVEVFTCIDRVAMMMYLRGMVITFEKLKPALKNMSTVDVTLDHLAQIETIYPEAYSFRKEKLRISTSGSTKPKYEIILKPNFEGLDGSNENWSECKATVLLQRKRKFYNVLLERVKKEHEKFLFGTYERRQLIPKEKLKRWHPRFQVEKCKPIELSNSPELRVIKLTSAKEVLEKVKECFKVDTNLKNPTEILKINSQSVEEKQDKNTEYYRRLQPLAKIVRNIFSSEGKNVLTLNLVAQKLQYSHSEKLTLDEIEKHIRLLCQLVPDWISLINLGKTDRLKVQKKIPFEKISKILEALARKKV